MQRKQKLNLNTSYIYSGIFILLGIIFIYFNGTPIYVVNDDLFMKAIISGAYLGVPNAYVVYMQYPLSFLLKSLYQINQSIPWYGAFLLSCHLVTISCLIQRSTNKFKKESNRFIMFIIITILCVVADFSQIMAIQYTVTAAIVGSTGIFWFVTSDTNHGDKRFFLDNIITIVFLTLSFCIRKNVLLMFIPLAGMVWLAKWFNEKRTNNKKIFFSENKVRYLGIGLIASFIFLAIWGIDKFAYSSNEWKEYAQYNEKRTKLVDYYGWPEYIQNQDLYDSLGITKETFEGAQKAYMLCMDNNINIETLTALVDSSKQMVKRNRNYQDSIKTIFTVEIEKLYSYIERPLNLMVVGLYILIFLCSLLGHNKRAFIAMGCLMIGRFVSWAYVIYGGRIPARITESLFMAELFILIGIALTYEIWKFNRRDETTVLFKMKKAFILVAAFIYFAVVLYSGRVDFIATEDYVDRREGTIQYLNDIIKYCGKDPENFYFIDNVSIMYFTENILSKEGYIYQNYMLFGGWLTSSPIYQEKIKISGIENVETDIVESDKIYVIFQENEECPKDYLMNYYTSKYDTFHYILVDVFSSQGLNFNVYQIRK